MCSCRILEHFNVVVLGFQVLGMSSGVAVVDMECFHRAVDCGICKTFNWVFGTCDMFP